MNYFAHDETPDSKFMYSPHTKIIVINLNSVDISEYRSSNFVKHLVCN